MTLNITVLSSQYVHQSADYRLWDPAKGEIVSDNSTKLLHVRVGTSMAGITYTGIGAINGRSTSQFLAKWLTDEPCDSIRELPQMIAARGSQWIDRIGRVLGTRYHHTYVLATFLEGKSYAYIISNFEEFGRPPLPRPEASLSVSVAEYVTAPIVLSTGSVTPALSREQRAVLTRICAAHPFDAARVRNAIQQLNRSASSRSPLPTISAECQVMSFDAHGNGADNGSVAGVAPIMIWDGVDVGKKLAGLVGGLASAQVIGSTYATSEGPAAADYVCEPQYLSAADDWRMIELAPGSAGGGSAMSVGRTLTAVGSAAPLRGRPDQPRLWMSDGTGADLPGLGGITGRALYVDTSSTILGEIEDSKRRLHACLWDERRELALLAVPGAYHSGLSGYNSIENTVGWASFDPTDGGQHTFRPVRWRGGAVPEVLDLAEWAEWGQAIDVGANGEVLVSAHKNRRPVSLLWHGREVRGIADDGVPFWPLGYYGPTKIVGMRQVPGDRTQHGAVWSEDEGVTRLDLPDGWTVTAVSRAGHLAGTTHVKGWSKPWIQLADMSEPLLLPSFAYHHSTITSIADNGVASGSQGADHGWHPVIWSHSSLIQGRRGAPSARKVAASDARQPQARGGISPGRPS